MSQTKPLSLDPDRLFPIEPKSRALSQALYDQVRDLPIISPHGHTDPSWFADNAPFEDALSLLVVPDHYLLRMFYSRGIDLSELGVPDRDGRVSVSRREGWRTFAKHYHLFLGTPSRLWLDATFQNIFGLQVTLTDQTADDYFDHINEQLVTPEFKPRALLDRFNVAFIATTEHALDPLPHHQTLHQLNMTQRVTTTFRPDDVLDPDFNGFVDNVESLSALTGESTTTFKGYLNALRHRRSHFKSLGATATDHGPATPLTANLEAASAEKLFDRCMAKTATPDERALFRGQMLTEMAKMSLDDGLVMQIHPGSSRNHNPQLFGAYGPDKGADIPKRVDYCESLKPLLDAVGNDKRLTLIAFTLDESNYARELAPLAGHYPALRLGPPWWFHDSPEGMLRYRRSVTETAGFYNTSGFNDDTRAFFSIPARHDMARRMDCRFLAEWVMEGRIDEDDAMNLISVLTLDLVLEAYRLDPNILGIAPHQRTSHSETDPNHDEVHHA